MSTQTAEAPTVPGSILAGKYRVERIIGQGGMGVVVEARHIQLDDRVALKFLLAEYATHPEASQRFLREAQAARKIKSEHIARVTDVGTLENGAPYMVMEFLEGRDLSKMLENGVLGVEDAVDYVIQGCDALAEAHSLGIVHRDIKPANLFLTHRANGMPLVKVLDFGISKVMNGQVDNLTRTTASMGSALYMSPEQMQQTRGVDHRTDIYALGISLYELLAGRQPFYADTLPQLCAEIFTGTPTPIREIRSDIPEGLAVVLERAYARDRSIRFQSVGELVVALAPFAPARSQGAVESIARLSGLDVAQLQATAAARVSMPNPVPAALTESQPRLSGGTVAIPDGIVTNQGIVLGGVPRTTGSGISIVAPAPAPSSKAPLIALGLAAVLAIGAGGVVLGRKGGSPAQAAPAAPTVAEAAPPTAATATATPTATATQAPPTAPAATAAPTAAPTATPTATTTATTATPPSRGVAHSPTSTHATPAAVIPKTTPAGPGAPQDKTGF